MSAGPAGEAGRGRPRKDDWIETDGPDGALFAPAGRTAGVLVIFSARSPIPPDIPSPTAFLARRLAASAGAPDLPIVRATQVHGRGVAIVRQPPRPEECADAGENDVLATALPGVALVVQSADCVPILLSGPGAIAVAHAGWRGSALGAASAAVEALRELGADPGDVDAWIGPAIGACCYQVGGEVASQFAGDFARRDCTGRFRLDLKSVNLAQLEAAGLRRERISIHPACTKCGGARYASYRRDGAAAGRMIGMIALRGSGPGTGFFGTPGERPPD
jgi:YfiH family protein